MSGINRDGAAPGGEPAAEQPAPWGLDRAALWAWVDDLLCGVAPSALAAGALKALCAQALDLHAPAVLVHALADGLYLDHLTCAVIIKGYIDRYGRPAGLYEVTRLRAVVRQLRRESAVVGQ